MKQCGVITSVNDGMAKILMERHSSCGSCNACKMGKEDMKMEIEAINKANAQVGQRVEVSMEEQNLLAAAFIVYIIPLTALIIGVVLTSTLLTALGSGENDIYPALMGFIFMALTFVGIKKKEKDRKSNTKYIPVITAIVNNEMTEK
ncbi:SoxR reducing system RseC family protein [Natronincola ferrireducens]|uniref:Positive regulator of sigma(E), RseC/MucC n=1 Tax=Natronincola ferrireducens TaxID=393762 RepID=A0A1G9CVL5_9FIRM|nr:SoxR reducing system RseC family protein [Natronincola ferrireducens]SDK55686.1 positive regulator of sigma(E), RseC/MucC [Natronincola ferrireducens]